MKSLALPPALLALAALALAPPAATAQVCVSTEDQKVVASDLAAGDIYGGAVAADGDVILVAGEWNDVNGTDSGSMYSYRFNGTSWFEEQRFEPGDAQLGDNFGRAVHVQGNTALVGAHWDDDSGTNAGSAYVFHYNGSAWVQEQKLTASDGQGNDRFGASVAVDGNAIAVGAWLQGADSRGAVYMFRNNGGTWSQEQKLTAPDAFTNDNFGRYVSLSGDALLVGAWKNDDDGTDSGSAYVYRHNGSSWVFEQKLTASDAAAGDFFGWACYLDGDTAVVGAYEDGNGVGAAYVYEFSGSTWSETQKLVASDAQAGQWFGYSIDLDDEWLLVAAPVSGTSTGSGSAYLYRHDGSQWVEFTKYVPSDGANQDKFGFHAALAQNTAVVGAWRDDDAGSDSGSAYVFERGDAYANTMIASPCAISLAAGGQQRMVIDMGAAHAGSIYWIFGSVTGTSPGVLFPGGVVLPVNFDAYFRITLKNPFLGIFSGFLSVLDADGESTAAFGLPPGSDPGLAGLTFYHAAAVSATVGTVDAASSPVEVLLDN